MRIYVAFFPLGVKAMSQLMLGMAILAKILAKKELRCLSERRVY